MTNQEIHLLTVRRVCVFVHPGQWAGGNLHLVAICDAQPDFEECVKRWKHNVCLYDGPPQVPQGPK